MDRRPVLLATGSFSVGTAFGITLTLLYAGSQPQPQSGPTPDPTAVHNQVGAPGTRLREPEISEDMRLRMERADSVLRHLAGKHAAIMRQLEGHRQQAASQPSELEAKVKEVLSDVSAGHQEMVSPPSVSQPGTENASSLSQMVDKLYAQLVEIEGHLKRIERTRPRAKASDQDRPSQTSATSSGP